MFYKESKTFLSDEQKNFLNWFCSKESNTPWYWAPNAAEVGDGGHHFIHHIINKDKGYYNQNPNQKWFEDILYNFAKEQKFKIKEIFRCAINITFNNGKIDRVPAHVDHDYKHKQLLLYLNNSSGETVILDKKSRPFKIVRPEEFKAISFDSVLHYHYFPINSVRRVVVYTFK
tara:strand:+ start:3105 stop:3623 length:519 start_codon:yes stop_codon:yes gene_type:complete